MSETEKKIWKEKKKKETNKTRLFIIMKYRYTILQQSKEGTKQRNNIRHICKGPALHTL